MGNESFHLYRKGGICGGRGAKLVARGAIAGARGGAAARRGRPRSVTAHTHTPPSPPLLRRSS